MMIHKLLFLGLFLSFIASGYARDRSQKTVGTIMEGVAPEVISFEGNEYLGYYIWNQIFKPFSTLKIRGGFVGIDTKIDAFQSDDGRLVSKDCYLDRGTLVLDQALVGENAKILNNARILGTAQVYGQARVFGSATVSENAVIKEKARVSGNASISGNAKVYGEAKVFGEAKIYGHTSIYHWAKIFGNTELCGYVEVGGNVSLKRTYKCDSSKLWYGRDFIY